MAKTAIVAATATAPGFRVKLVGRRTRPAVIVVALRDGEQTRQVVRRD